MRKIHMLMGLGSQRISNEQMSELTELSRQASVYEKVRYDYVRQSPTNAQADSSVT